MDKRKMKQYIIIAIIILILLLVWLFGKKAIKKLETVYREKEIEQPQVYEQPIVVEKTEDKFIIVEEKEEK